MPTANKSPKNERSTPLVVSKKVKFRNTHPQSRDRNQTGTISAFQAKKHVHTFSFNSSFLPLAKSPYSSLPHHLPPLFQNLKVFPISLQTLKRRGHQLKLFPSPPLKQPQKAGVAEDKKVSRGAYKRPVCEQEEGRKATERSKREKRVEGKREQARASQQQEKNPLGRIKGEEQILTQQEMEQRM